MDSAAKVLGAIGGFATGVWGLWCTWVAFFGGTFPIPFINWTTSGDIVQGLLFLFIVTPILTGLVSQIFVWLVGGILVLISLATGKRES